MKIKYKQSLKTRVFKINQGFITQKIDKKITIFFGEESVLYTLNETAAYIFQGLKLNWDKEKIQKGLVKKFGASIAEAREDLEEFTNLLLKKKIITEIR